MEDRHARVRTARDVGEQRRLMTVRTARRAHEQIFAALLVQALAAVGLSFSTSSLVLSLLLAGVILAAVGWRVQSGARLHKQRQ